ncbi:MAG: PKD domain-containing protein [Gaiellales bacterium]
MITNARVLAGAVCAAGCLVAGGAITPGAAQAAAGGPTAYVRDFDGVTPISISRRAALPHISLSPFESETPSPHGIAITPDGKTAYVSSEDDSGIVDTVTPIDLVTQTARPPINVCQFPGGLAITPNGRTLYVSCTGFGPNGSVVPVDTRTNTVGAAIPVPAAAGPLAISPNGATVWASSMVENSSGEHMYLTPIDVATGTAGPRFHSGQGFPTGITLTPGGGSLYMTNFEGQVIHVNLSTRAVGVISVGGSPAGVAVNPQGTAAYVVDDNGAIVPINLVTHTVGARITVGLDPFGIVWGPAGKTAWVVNTNAVAGEVGGSLIPVTNGAAGTPIPAGNAADAVVITPDQAPVAKFSATAARAGRPSLFDAGGSRARSTAIATYAWTFGDGSAATTTQPCIHHVYARSGAYTVTLTLTDRAGTSTTRVFTGQQVLRNGSSVARAVHTLTVG